MTGDRPHRLLDSEDAFLRLIDRHFNLAGERTLLGRGDDCAVLDWSRRVCVSTDLFLEDAHFRRSYFEPEDIGYKALAVNLSDIAAMGGVPTGFTLSLIAPRPADYDFFDRLFAGMAGLAKESGADLVGGDISGGDKLGFSITIWGEAAGEDFIRRSDARPGDVLFLAGNAGMARAGLLALEEIGERARRDYPACAAAHLRPAMHLAEAAELGRFGRVRALMDLSDGLARDLPRLLDSAGAELYIPEDFLHPEARELCMARGLDPVEHFVLGGEDYGLLGAVAEEDFPELERRVPTARRIGRVTGGPGLDVNGRPFAAAGFDHFAQGDEHG